jgi:hypothetical protein
MAKEVNNDFERRANHLLRLLQLSGGYDTSTTLTLQEYIPNKFLSKSYDPKLNNFLSTV